MMKFKKKRIRRKPKYSQAYIEARKMEYYRILAESENATDDKNITKAFNLSIYEQECNYGKDFRIRRYH